MDRKIAVFSVIAIIAIVMVAVTAILLDDDSSEPKDYSGKWVEVASNYMDDNGNDITHPIVTLEIDAIKNNLFYGAMYGLAISGLVDGNKLNIEIDDSRSYEVINGEFWSKDVLVLTLNDYEHGTNYKTSGSIILTRNGADTYYPYMNVVKVEGNTYCLDSRQMLDDITVTELGYEATVIKQSGNLILLDITRQWDTTSRVMASLTYSKEKTSISCGYTLSNTSMQNSYSVWGDIMISKDSLSILECGVEGGTAHAVEWSTDLPDEWMSLMGTYWSSNVHNEMTNDGDYWLDENKISIIFEIQYGYLVNGKMYNQKYGEYKFCGYLFPDDGVWKMIIISTDDRIFYNVMYILFNEGKDTSYFMRPMADQDSTSTGIFERTV